MSADGTPFLVRRIPGAGRLLAGGADRRATSTREPYGTVWRPTAEPDAASLPVVVLLGPRPSGLAWIASSIAVALPAVVVVAAQFSDPLGALETITEHAPTLGADPDRLAIIGESDAAAAAIAGCAGPRQVMRLALLSPVVGGTLTPDGVPPALLQFSAASPHAAVLRVLERSLRASGVAVRSIDYTDLADGWVRYPRAVRGSQRGFDDLLGFLRRGFGVESTFHVIPGWDLH